MPQYLVCADTGFFADDVKATCAECGAAIVHRPHASFFAVKVCIRCAARALRDDKNATVDVTDETVREVALYAARTKGVQ